MRFMEQTTIILVDGSLFRVCLTKTSAVVKGRQNRYSPRQIRDWSHYLRAVANVLNDSNNELANHFYNVHYAIGPEYITECNVFALDKENLELVAEQDGKTPEEVMRGLIESIEIVIREGDKLGPEFMDQSVWNSGLRDYLCGLELYLKLKNASLALAETPVKLTKNSQ